MNNATFQPQGIEPTTEQRAIQLERRKHVIVEANAGAAKTTTLALRMAQALARGAQPEHLLALTYTDAAVLALRQALARLGVATAVRQRLKLQTFDAFCTERWLAIEGSSVVQHPTPEALKPHLLMAIERVLDNPDERRRDEFAMEGTGEGAVEGLLASFGRIKGTLQLQLDAQERSITPSLAQELGHDYLTLRVFSRYEHLRRGGHPDHFAFRAPHDATYDMARALLSDEGFADAASGLHPLALGLRLVLVDEMHDTNRAMFTVLQHLLHQNPAAFVGVGDRDQVIHAVAGADASFMGETFDREIAVATRFALTASYRFGPTLARSVGLLAHKACASGKAQDTAVALMACERPIDGLRHVVEVVRQGTGLSPQATASQIAVLLRQPHQSVALENHLLDQGVDYRTAGFDTYLMRPEVLFVRGLIAYAREGFADIESLSTRERICQAMLLFASSSVDTQGEASSDEPTSFQQRARLTEQAIREVATQPGLFTHFVDNQVLRNAPKAVRVQMHAAIEVLAQNATDILLQGFVRALEPQRLARRVMVRTADIAQVGAHIQGLIDSAATFDNVESFFRAMNLREVRHQAMRKQDCIWLASIEASKGLEFDHVILPGLNRGEFAVQGDSTDNRNLLYVGMTRAREQLTVLFDPARPSKYLMDAGLIQPNAV